MEGAGSFIEVSSALRGKDNWRCLRRGALARKCDKDIVDVRGREDRDTVDLHNVGLLELLRKLGSLSARHVAGGTSERGHAGAAEAIAGSACNTDGVIFIVAVAVDCDVNEVEKGEC